MIPTTAPGTGASPDQPADVENTADAGAADGPPSSTVPSPPASPPEVTSGWVIRDRAGNLVGWWPKRADAVRHLGEVALQGASLPLTVHQAGGKPTGDRLG